MVKKSELYNSLWKSCDELRGGMDASQYKDYVLVLLFVKYVSDKYAGDKKALIEVPSGGSFSDMVALKGNPEIGDKINQIIGKLAEANELKGVIDQAPDAAWHLRVILNPSSELSWEAVPLMAVSRASYARMFAMGVSNAPDDGARMLICHSLMSTSEKNSYLCWLLEK